MKKFIILIPVFNDWESLSKLIKDISLELKALKNDKFKFVIINDGSTNLQPKIDKPNNILSIKILNMKINKGHTLCIAYGIHYVLSNEEFDSLILMDGDGEDRPEEIGKFIDFLKYDSKKPIVGERIKRSEGAIFKFSYNIHKLITFIFTGQSIKFGNYTCLPKSTVAKMINEKATWSSFSGSLTKLEKNRSTIPSIRGERYFGPSKMSFYNLIKHSLSIIAVFKTNVIIRSILFFLIYIFLISKKITYITSIPLIAVIGFVISVLAISKRENANELNGSLSNIENIDVIKNGKQIK